MLATDTPKARRVGHRFLFSFLIYFTILPIFLYSHELSLDVGAGYRHDSFNWNISGGKDGPNILSDLKWKDIRSCDIFTELKIHLPYQFYFRFNGDYGKIFDGKCIDKDYLGHNRTQIFAHSRSQANKGELFDFSFGTAYECCFFQERLKIGPVFGFSHQEQHLRMIHGKLILDALDHFLEGSLKDLHSNYRAQWYGPWLGLDYRLCISQNVELFGSYEYHWSFYRATGHWNLRSDFLDDFEHCGCGSGSLIIFGGHYTLCKGWKMGAFFKCQSMHLRRGIDRIFYLNENTPTMAATCLNAVNWHTFSALATIGYEY